MKYKYTKSVSFVNSPYSSPPGNYLNFEASIWVKIIIFPRGIKEFITSSKGLCSMGVYLKIILCTQGYYLKFAAYFFFVNLLN